MLDAQKQTNNNTFPKLECELHTRNWHALLVTDVCIMDPLLQNMDKAT